MVQPEPNSMIMLGDSMKNGRYGLGISLGLGVVGLSLGYWALSHHVHERVKAQFVEMVGADSWQGSRANDSRESGATQWQPSNDTKDFKQVRYELINGWNLVAFPIRPDGIHSAADLMVAIAAQGGYVTTVSDWQGDAWREYSQRGDVPFGEDFTLEVGKAYFVKNHQRTTFVVEGEPLTESERELTLQPGWNAVGVSQGCGESVECNQELSLSAEAMLDQLHSQMPEGKESVTDWDRWSGGNWDGLVKRWYGAGRVEVYGNDYRLENYRGYFVRSNERIEDWNY